MTHAGEAALPYHDRAWSQDGYACQGAVGSCVQVARAVVLTRAGAAGPIAEERARTSQALPELVKLLSPDLFRTCLTRVLTSDISFLPRFSLCFSKHLSMNAAVLDLKPVFSTCCCCLMHMKLSMCFIQTWLSMCAPYGRYVPNEGTFTRYYAHEVQQ